MRINNFHHCRLRSASFRCLSSQARGFIHGFQKKSIRKHRKRAAALQRSVSHLSTPIRRPPFEAQLRANRLNAQKSTGPRTEEGKQRASLKATRHGLTGQVLALTPDETKALHALIGDLEKQHLPGNTHEKHLVHMLAQLQYRLHRIMATEHNLFAIGLTENSDLWDVNHPEAQMAFVLAETLAARKTRCSRFPFMNSV